MVTDISESTRECEICWEFNEIPSIAPTKDCVHTPQVCVQCLCRLTNNILQGTNRNHCPVEGCPCAFSFEDLQRWADPLALQRRLIADLEEDELFVRCLRAECHYGQYHAEGDKEPIVKCYNCGIKQCFIHRVPWHEGITCAQWRRRENRKSNRMSRLALKKTKRCPSCKAPIHKSQGCDLITCRCTFKFCYACRVPYDDFRRGNHHHRRLCPHYASKSSTLRDRARWWEFWTSRWWRRARWEQ